MWNQVTDEMRNASAILVMRMMLVNYSKTQGISLPEALLRFARSNTYEVLFDFSTGVWREGPRYLQATWDEEIANNHHKA